MENKTYKCAFAGHIRSVMIRAVIITFCAAFVTLFLYNSFYAAGTIFWFALIGSAIYELINSSKVTVRPDGVLYEKPGKQGMLYKYDLYYFSEVSGKTTVKVERRKTARVEELPCHSFDKKLFAEMMAFIQKSQSQYFLNRSHSSVVGKDNYAKAKSPSTGKPVNTAAKAASTAVKPNNTNNTASAAAKNNPYSKEYKGRTQAAPAQNPAAAPEKILKTVQVQQTPITTQPSNTQNITSAQPKPAAPKPAATVSQPKITVKPEPPKGEISPKSDTNIVDSVLTTFNNEIPSDYNKIPELPKFDDTAYRQLPDINSIGSTSKNDTPEKTAFTHDHGEDFHKQVFYYPKRAITEAVERTNALAVLYIIGGAILSYLIWYLVYASGWYVEQNILYKAAGVFAVLAVVAIVLFLTVRKNRLGNIFSKLEITDNYIVIDNKRYKYANMSNKHISPNDISVPVRKISFTCDGANIVYTLGPSKKPSRSSNTYFTRYSELCDALREKGFK
ncbi:MAG: hypothetical protein HFE63_02730 [Clostridiales bacterium]|nr:hypothetical protein [Clostridiales bacterium]